MDKFEQMLAQMMTGIKSDSDWLIETQHRQGREYEGKLMAAEQLLRRALDFVAAERQRFGGYRQEQPPPPEQVRGPRDRAIAEMRQRTNSGEQPNGRAASQ